MKPETAAAIARRIGMVLQIGNVEWHDPMSNAGPWGEYVHVDDLTDYLATGDRPLRVVDTLGKDVLLSKHGPSWACVVYWTSGPQISWSGEGDTPALAILACAAAMEEGHG